MGERLAGCTLRSADAHAGSRIVLTAPGVVGAEGDEADAARDGQSSQDEGVGVEAGAQKVKRAIRVDARRRL